MVLPLLFSSLLLFLGGGGGGYLLLGTVPVLDCGKTGCKLGTASIEFLRKITGGEFSLGKGTTSVCGCRLSGGNTITGRTPRGILTPPPEGNATAPLSTSPFNPDAEPSAVSSPAATAFNTNKQQTHADRHLAENVEGLNFIVKTLYRFQHCCIY